MNATQRLHDLGQSLWLDNITRDLLTSRTLDLYISDLSVTGLISNPTIFDSALRASHDYDGAIRRRYREGCSGETLFFELAVEDLTAAADLFRPIHVATHGLDGWVSLEVSPLFANDPLSTIAQARQLHARAGRPNVFIKIPGTPDGLTAVEETIFAGIPVNVTLLFSWEQYRAAADAYVRGIERRVAAGLDPSVFSVASLFISRWDKAVMRDSPPDLRNRLGIAVAQRAYQTYAELAGSERWLRLKELGAHPQRLLWASTGTKDPAASDSCTCPRWRRRTPSTPCLNKPCLTSPITASSAPNSRLTVVMPMRFSRGSPRLVSMSAPLRIDSNWRLNKRSTRRG
jgi:transaldolase